MKISPVMFTVNEVRVIIACTLGMSAKMMAAHLEMKYNTLCGHLKIIFAKLGIHSMSQLISYAHNNGYNKT